MRKSLLLKSDSLILVDCQVQITKQENFWESNSKRTVILLGDAPSLDSTKSEHKLKEIIEISKSDKINMNFYPIVLSPQDFGFVMDVPKMQNLTFIENLYPNPCRGRFTLKLNQLGNYTFELFNQKGNYCIFRWEI